ncbi:Two pore potassium channel protein sup-9 [Diplonema papillatum]|nr:Two pore potassium channel protein sup-9 [Diplonema papillatum]
MGMLRKEAAHVARCMGLVFLYLVIGGATLASIESRGERRGIERGQVALNRAQLSAEQRVILEEGGLCRFRSTDDAEWTVAGATFFSLTAVTTIGYGNIAPATDSGRLFTMAYSLVGIAILARVIKEISDTCGQVLKSFDHSPPPLLEVGQVDEDGRLTEIVVKHIDSVYDQFFADQPPLLSRDCVKKFLDALQGRDVDPLVADCIIMNTGSARNPVFSRANAARVAGIYYKLLPELPQQTSGATIAAYACGIFVWLSTWAVLFSVCEGWRYRESFWFCFVTLSTIGFGDYHPTTYEGRVLAFFFVVPGLCVVGWFLNAIRVTSQAKHYWLLQRRHAAGKLTDQQLALRGLRPLCAGRDDDAFRLLAEGSSAADDGSLLWDDGCPAPPPPNPAARKNPGGFFKYPAALDDVAIAALRFFTELGGQAEKKVEKAASSTSKKAGGRAKKGAPPPAPAAAGASAEDEEEDLCELGLIDHAAAFTGSPPSSLLHERYYRDDERGPPSKPDNSKLRTPPSATQADPPLKP